MSLQDAIEFQRQKEQLAALAAQVEQLTLEQAAMKQRLAALEAGKDECPTCVQRRAADAERQRRSRQRHVAEATEPALCSPELP